MKKHSMKSNNYREAIYKNYITNIFRKDHQIENVQKEYSTYYKYFKKNYSKYLPEDKDAKILDIGCGIGGCLNYLMKEGYRNSEGIDNSEEIVNFCIENNLPVKMVDMVEFLKKNKNAYDVIIFNDVIEHLTKEEIFEILKLILGSLKKGGILISKTPNMTNPLLASAGKDIDFTHEVGFTELSFNEVLKASGFSNIHIFGSDIYVFYLNPLNYLAKLLSLLISGCLYLISYLYGRKSLKIFTKDLVAVAQKA